MSEYPLALSEEYAWHWNEDNDRPVVTEADVHDEAVLAAELALADQAWAQRKEDSRCLRGCPHHGRCDHWPL